MKLRNRALLLDQNVRIGVVAWLRGQRLDVVACSDVGLGRAVDTAVLDWARDHGRILITHDTDFGEIGLRHGRSHVGIAIIRPSPRDQEVTIAQLRHALEQDVPNSSNWLLTVDIRHGRPRARLRMAN